jgi:rod shape-determining protein MreD
MTSPVTRERGPATASAPASRGRISQLSSVGSHLVHPVRYLGVVVLLLVVLLLQRTLLSSLGIPLGTPDLLAIVVSIVALQTGPALGSFTGFLAGFGADLLSDHALGRLAAVLCVVGYLIGMLRQDAQRSVAIPLAAVVAGGMLAALLFAGTGVLVDDSRAGGSLLLQRCLAAVLYGLVLTPFLFPFIARILTGKRRTGQEAR